MGVWQDLQNSFPWGLAERGRLLPLGGGYAVATGLGALRGDFRRKDSLSLLDNTNSLSLYTCEDSLLIGTLQEQSEDVP